VHACGVCKSGCMLGDGFGLGLISPQMLGFIEASFTCLESEKEVNRVGVPVPGYRQCRQRDMLMQLLYTLIHLFARQSHTQNSSSSSDAYLIAL